MLYGWVLSGILLLTAFGVGAYKDRQIDELSAAIVTQRVTVLAQTDALADALKAFDECQVVNDRNTATREWVTRRAAEAERNAQAAEAKAAKRQTAMDEYMKEYRENAGNECYRMDGDELPDDFVDRVFSPASVRANN